MDISKILPLIMAMNGNGENKNNMLTAILPELLKANGQGQNQNPMNSMLMNMLSNNFANNAKTSGNESLGATTPGVATPYPQNNYASAFGTNNKPTEPPTASNFPPHVEVNSNGVNTTSTTTQVENVFPTSNFQTAQSSSTSSTQTTEACPLKNNAETMATAEAQAAIAEQTATKKEDNCPPVTNAFGYKRVY